MKKLIFVFLLFAVISCVYPSNLGYKYTSSIPIKFVQLSKIKSADELKELLGENSSLTIFCIDDNSINKNV